MDPEIMAYVEDEACFTGNTVDWVEHHLPLPALLALRERRQAIRRRYGLGRNYAAR